jgi:intracellular sulfur oxidation DsrE/DsrF family protein
LGAGLEGRSRADSFDGPGTLPGVAVVDRWHRMKPVVQTDQELEMTINRPGRTVLVYAAVAIAGCCAMAFSAQTQTPDKPTAPKTAQKKTTRSAPAAMHKVAIQVNQNDKAVMDLALNNVRNIAQYYKGKGESVAIEVVAYGPGLHMLRSDTSPVKDRIASMALETPSLTFIACANTQANQSKAEGKPVSLLSEAKVVPSGVVRLIQLQKEGYAYIRP